ncbi:hypothetical protein GWO43_02110, partial [candidate division KSB1 bacterium]|nr:hypothetical protein [candidate division KSB1 bacterium]NIS22866.1 hypothetical protein [candidate division KSB1 bacterium]NIT69704.1 hypothetical protein [candidate division KSB1 bacterium]NIU23372.1 hypothetical protein [candidate division KSB1 bacterium]NIU92290.1 hypothetical protein [candidate division KSB1 bacterium]
EKKNEESKDLSRRLADLERERDAFKNQLSKKENQLANLSFQLKDQALEHLKLSEQLAARTTESKDQALEHLKLRLSEQLAARTTESADLKHQVQTANSKLVRRDKQLKGLSQSFSWKLTSPLRWISHFFIKVV